jgi:hypothetical protein
LIRTANLVPSPGISRSPAEFAALIVRETRKWSEVIRVAGVKGE